MLRELANNLWVAEQPLRYLGIEVGTRTTVIRLDDGRLFVHSPAQLRAELRDDLEKLGELKFVIAPNRFHHLFIGDYRLSYPACELHCAPGLEKKRPDLKFDAVLTDQPPSGWAGQLDQIVFRAFPPLNEVVFLHRASRTLIFTDLLFNVTHASSTISRIALRLDGAFGGPAVARTFRLLLKFRREQARASIQRILDWDFDRVILAHGDAIETGGKNAVAKAWSFL